MKKKKHKHSFAEQPAYRKWVKARDRALEKLHTNTQLRSSDVMRKLLTGVLQVCQSHYFQLHNGDISAADQLDHGLKMIFHEAIQQFYLLIIQLRRNSYVLAKASEAEIIARLIKKPVKAIVTRQDIHRVVSAEAFAGGDLLRRLKLYADRLRRRVVSQAQSAAIGDDEPKKFLTSVLAAFPRPRRVKRPTRILKPSLMEADDPRDPFARLGGINPPERFGGENDEDLSAAIDLIDDAAWQEMVEEYKQDVVPSWRGPESIVDIPTTDGDTWYGWELERDLTNEFVQSVRDGTIEAAKENGITDFVWIAVVDDVTDACCLWRDGLLVSEIEEQLADHESADAECDVEDDGLTPPLHFNCRCTLAPATDEIPEKPNDGMVEFDDWLNS